MIILGVSSSSADVMGMSTIESISSFIVVGCILFYLAAAVAVAVLGLLSDSMMSRLNRSLLLRGVNVN